MKKSRLLMFLFLFLWSIGMMAADGDVFTVKVDEYDMTFRVLSEVDKTVQTGAVLEKPEEGKFDYKAARCIDEGVSGTLTIPAVVSHDGADYHVVRIGVASFYALKALEKVVIPEGVESIGVDAFSNYEFEALSLSQVILPSTLRIIENRAFSQIDGAVGEGNFKSIVIPEGVERIEAAAFVNNSMLESVQLPSTLKFLGDNAFGVSALTSITVPASTIEIEGQPFAFTRTLTSLIVEAENPFYDSRDNCNAIIETATNTLQEGTVATVIPSSIRIIGKSAFSGLGNLGKFNIPEGVECIEESAFYNCLYESLSLPHTLRIIGDYAFSHWGDLGLSTIVIPEGVETIGEYAFSGQNEMLKRVELPSTLKSLGSYIFNSCPNLEDVYCTATVPCKITGSGILMPPFGDNSGMVSATLHVPVGSKGFYESAFGFDHFSRFVEIGKEDLPTFSAMVDGYEMFFRVLDEDAKTVQIGLGEKEQNCIKADSNDERWGTILNIQIPTSVTDPSTGKTYSVTAIGEYAFSYIMPQQDLVIPEGITSIYSNAFLTNQYQVNLQSVKLPESLNEISSHAFEGHMKLTDINMPKNLKIIGNSAFYGIGIKELTLPEGITYIGNDVFGCCTSLTNVKLPSDMKVLPEGMFRDSPFVVLSIELPEGLEEIGTKALMSTKIEHLKLPSTLKKIGTYGVQVISYYLKDVTALSATPPVLEDGSFTYWENNECDVITLYVPIGSKSAYEKAPGWSEFKNIVEIDETVEMSTRLQIEMYHEWDDCTATSKVTNEDGGGELHLGEPLGSGALVYGIESVQYQHYADLTGYSELVIEGTPDVILRVLINRLEVGNGGGDDNGGALTELNVVIGDDGTATVSLEDYPFVHLNAIKTAWHSPAGYITSLTLKKKGDVNGDGNVNVGDIMAVINVMATNAYDDRADVNQDGKVNVGDIMAVINIMAEK